MRNSLTVCLAWHNINSTNYGVSALGISQIAMLQRISADLELPLKFETLGQNNASGVALSIKDLVEKKYGIEIGNFNFSLKEILTDALHGRFTVLRKFASYDVMLDVGGGDSFSDIYGSKRFLYLVMTKFLGRIFGTRLVFSPQTIGPFKSGWSKKLARVVMRQADAVFVRDRLSEDYANSLGVEVRRVSDMAFCLPYAPQERKSRHVGVNVSGLLWNGGYTGKNDFSLNLSYPDFIIRQLDGLLKRGCVVHLVGHVIDNMWEVEDDYRALLKVKEHFADFDNVVVAPRFESPIEAKTYFSQLDFFTGARMHATIGAISSGVPTIPVAYSRKFAGLYDSLGYRYTLNAYELDVDTMIARFFDYYDNHRSSMQADLDIANSIARELNAEYETFLKEFLSHEFAR